ncbi:aspartate aminotransferase family protein [Acidimangrovimonas sediminis]|uniref:aspartate aminotransferase family protein n=1 Tax=Acidimangrovimonas sediminis TaxID=2056283 RepID=UPI0018EB48BD|nr:aspartate aminotransferase family protein [Acidimangrovimonas sediminis]
MSPRDRMINAFDPARADGLSPAAGDLIRRRAQAMGPMYRLLYAEPVEVARASGAEIWSPAGERYLDAYNNVPVLGHSHPAVAEAVAAQLGRYNTNTRYLEPMVVDYAERLLATFPGPLGHVMFTCSGSEAVDLSLRIARRRTGAQGIVVTRNAYHGNSLATAALSPSSGPGVPLDPAVRVIPAPEDAPEVFLAALEAAICDLQRHGFGLAAVLFDSVFSSDGLWLEPAGLLGRAAGIARAQGGLWIADEVQPGFGRMGHGLWGFDRHGVVPDLVALGKPMGNGLPVAAVVTRPEHVADFGREARYFNTFGGNPVCIAAASAVLDTIVAEGLVDRARRVGDGLRAALEDLALRHARVAAVRGAGLYLAVEFRDPETGVPDPDTTLAVIGDLRRRGILISGCGAAGNCLKIRPPLCFSAAQAEELSSAIDLALGTLAPGGA